MTAQATATRLLGKKGQTVTLTSRTAGTYDTATGTAAITTATQTAKAVILPLSQGLRKAGDYAPAGDVQCLLSAVTTAGAALTAPDLDDTVTDVNGRVMTIVEVAQIAPDGTVALYDLKLRAHA